MELRQLKEDEQSLLERSVLSMRAMYEGIQATRAQQGHALTRLELAVVMKEPEEESWAAGSLTRQKLDVLLLAAEMEAVEGLPPFPQPMPTPTLADLPPPFRWERGEER